MRCWWPVIWSAWPTTPQTSLKTLSSGCAEQTFAIMQVPNFRRMRFRKRTKRNNAASAPPPSFRRQLLNCLIFLGGLALRQLVLLLLLTPLFAQNSGVPHQVNLPTSKVLNLPTPGYIGQLNGFTPTIALSPDGHYAAFLNDGYGAQQEQAHQSIGILDLQSNQATNFPEERLSEEAKQSYFIGLAFSSDGGKLYASIGSITDPTGEKPGDLGNGIAVYGFRDGKVSPDRFLKIAPQKIADGKRIAFDLNMTALAKERKAIPYPAGLGIVPGKPDKLLVANNLSDTVLLLDSTDGHVVQSFDVSTHEIIPNSYPHTVVTSHDGHYAWCSLWNASRVAQLDLQSGKAVRLIAVSAPEDASAPGSHPTAMLLSP